MARNVEIKARLSSIEAVLPAVRALATSGPTLIAQDDTFFNCPNGRLKLRAFAADDGQLIFYQRQDQAGPKESFYLITPTAEPDNLREALTLAWGQCGRIRKLRTLFMFGAIRIHLDRVEALGDFLELEVVLTPSDTTESAVEVARRLMSALGIAPQQLVEQAYVDLL